jgi:hypothetical protein
MEERVLRPRNSDRVHVIEEKSCGTNAERARAFRAKLKENEEEYRQFRDYENLRVQVYRLGMSEEKREEYNEKCKYRMREYRKRKKEQGEAEAARSKKKRKKTRAEKEQQRAKWRDAKTKERLNWTSQKKRRVNERRRARYALEKVRANEVEPEDDQMIVDQPEQLIVEREVQVEEMAQVVVVEQPEQLVVEPEVQVEEATLVVQPEVQVEEATLVVQPEVQVEEATLVVQPKDQLEMKEVQPEAEPVYSSAAKRQCVSRVRKLLPASPQAFTDVVASLIKSATPKKKSAMKKKFIYSPDSKKKLEYMEATADRIRTENKSKKKKKTEIGKKRLLAHVIASELEGNTVKWHQKHYGISRKVLTRIQRNKNNIPALLEERKRRKDSIPKEILLKIHDFFEKRDMARVLPCTALVQRNGGAKVMLECSLQRLHEEFVRETGDKICYSKFAALRPKNVLTMSKTKLINCLCEYCTNIELKVPVLGQILKNSELKDKYAVSNATLCTYADIPSKACLDRLCQDCGPKLLVSKYPELLDNGNILSWGRWEKVTNPLKPDKQKMVKVTKTGSCLEFTKELKEELVSFSSHLFNAKWQHDRFSEITRKPPTGWVVMCIDYAENYACTFQDEVQAAHFAYEQATIHPVMAYYKCTHDNCPLVVEDSLVMISPDTKHCSDSTQLFIKTAAKHLQEKEIPTEKLVIFSDGAPTHYKNKTNFNDLSHSQRDLGCQAERHFFGSRHGKGPCDRETGTIKKCVVMAVKSRRTVLANAKDFYEYVNQNMTRPTTEEDHVHFKRSFFWCPKVDRTSLARKARRNVQHVKDTRDMHQFVPVSPKMVLHRERSCFCGPCKAGGSGICENAHITGIKILTDLSTGKGQPSAIVTSQQQSETEPSQAVSTEPPSQAVSTEPPSQAVSTEPPSQAASTEPPSQAVSTEPSHQSESAGQV